MDDSVIEGERVLIINNSSPSYRLTQIWWKDLWVHPLGANPSFTKIFDIPRGSLPSLVKVSCCEPFGDGISFRVGHVSSNKSEDFYISETELSEAGEWNCKTPHLYEKPNQKHSKLSLDVLCKNNPDAGMLWWHVEFKFPTDN